MALSDYEDALRSLIHDDDKLVTYKFVSKQFEIHVNVAKNILKEYWEKHKQEEKIVATFLIIGSLKDGSIRVEVVKEENLSTAKSKFTNVNCEHLYSLQKCLESVELLALVNDYDLRFSSIKCFGELREPNDDDRIREEIKHVSSAKPIKDTVKEEVKKKVIAEKPKSMESNKRDHSQEKEEEEEKKVSPTNKSTEKKVSPTNKTTKGNKVPKKPVQSTQSGFNNLFGKVPPKPKENVDNENTKTDIKRVTEKKEKTLKVEDSKKKTEEKVSRTKSKTSPVSRGKKRDRSQEIGAKSKRKRLIVAESSDDDSNKSNNSEEEEEEPMEVEEEQPRYFKQKTPPPVEMVINGKRMVEKFVEKTFKDDDGYMITKKVSVFEEVEEDKEPKDNKEPKEPKDDKEPKEPKESKKPKQEIPKFKEVISRHEPKKKQMSLTSFFKKA